MPFKKTANLSLDSLLKTAIGLGKSAANLSNALTEHANAASRVNHGDVGRGPATIEPIDPIMRSKLTMIINGMNDFRMAMRHSMLIGEHDEREKAKITLGHYC